MWAAMTSQVQRSAASGLLSWGQVQPSFVLIMRKVCSSSKWRKNACQRMSAAVQVRPVLEDHSQTERG